MIRRSNSNGSSSIRSKAKLTKSNEESSPPSAISTLKGVPPTAVIIGVLLVVSNLALLLPLVGHITANKNITTTENTQTEMKMILPEPEDMGRIIKPENFASYKEYLNNKKKNNPATIHKDEDADTAAITNGRTRAIVTVSMGKTAAQSKIVERFVWSARQPHLGNYTGWIILITDSPVKRYQSLQKHSFHNNATNDPTVLVYNPFQEHYEANLKWRDMTYKRFKTYILEYVGLDSRMDSVEVVYYLDVDIIFSRPVDQAFSQLEQQYNIAPNAPGSQYPNQSKMFMFENSKPEYKVQGGQFVVHRRAATGCLSRWREFMIEYIKDPKDQVFLNKMVKEQDEPNSKQLARCQIVPMGHQEYISFPNRTHMEEVFAQRQGARSWPRRLADWVSSQWLGRKRRDDDPQDSYGPLTGHQYTALVHIKNDGSPRFTDKRLFQSYVQDVFQFEYHGDDEMGLAEKMIMTAGHQSKGKFAAIEQKVRRQKRKEQEELKKKKEEQAKDQQKSNSNDDKGAVASRTSDDKRAIFLISMGEKAANNTFVERFCWTALNIGKYNGWIVLLTDADQSRYQQQLDENNKFVILHPNLHKNLPKSTFSYAAMNYKQYKTYVLEYMDFDKRFDDVELVYYLDVDIVIGNRMQPLFDNLEEHYQIGKGDSSPRIWMWSGHHKRANIPQGGQMILHRKRSQTCLEEWRSFLMTDFKSLADQDAMKKLLNDKSRKCDFVVMPRDAKYIDFPETSDVARRVKQLQKPGSRKFKYSTLIHFRNTANVMKDVPPDALEAYLRDVMGFKPDQRDHRGITTYMIMVTPTSEELALERQRNEAQKKLKRQ